MDPGELEGLKRLIKELEKTRQAEILQAKQVAFHEGRNKGREENEDDVKAAIDRFTRQLSEVSSLRKRIRDHAEADVVQLALAIARRIMRRELAIDAEAMQGIVHAALQKLQNRDLIRIRVYPEGVEALTRSMRISGAPPSVQVISDPALKVGDLFFETSAGELNASLETQLREVERGLADRLARQP